MTLKGRLWAPALSVALMASTIAAPTLAEETPKYGGTLTYMIPADGPPSFDGHREATYATVHSAAPYYSVLIGVNPSDPGSPTDFVCDLCTEIPQPIDGGKTYVFKIRDGVKFHDGSPLTAYDVAESWRKIVDPPEGVTSARQSFYIMVDKIETPDPLTVVFRLKFPTSAFLPALADPFTWIYKKEILDKDPRWYEKNIMGSGPFKFVDYQAGQSIKGKRNPDYYHKGLPYLNGVTGIYADKQSVRVEAIRSDRVAIEFRSFPPSAVDELVGALGDKITVQKSDWNCALIVTPNHQRKPFDDARVRRALTLALDRWHSAPALSKIAIVHTVGGIVFPGSPLAATNEELQQIAGYWPDTHRGKAPVEGGGGRRALFRAAQSQRRPAFQASRHLAGRRMEQDRGQSHSACAAHWPVVRGTAQWQLRCRHRRQLPKCDQPGARRQQVPAALGVHRTIRKF
jgi:peptide/nickel transport system substrate-binding protein